MAYSTKQTAESYCEIQTADSPTTLVNHDGSLLSIIEVNGYSALLGQEEFNDVHNRIQTALSSMLSRPGYSIQVFFGYNKDNIRSLIHNNFVGSMETAKNIGLDLNDLMEERIENLSHYCSDEKPTLRYGLVHLAYLKSIKTRQ